jgi:hypothetical protein
MVAGKWCGELAGRHGLQRELPANKPAENIDTDVQGGSNQDKHHRLVELDVLDGAVDIEAKGIDAQYAQNGGFPHDDFPPIEKERKK